MGTDGLGNDGSMERRIIRRIRRRVPRAVPEHERAPTSAPRPKTGTEPGEPTIWDTSSVPKSTSR